MKQRETRAAAETKKRKGRDASIQYASRRLVEFNLRQFSLLVDRRDKNLTHP